MPRAVTSEEKRTPVGAWRNSSVDLFRFDWDMREWISQTGYPLGRAAKTS